ncbi:MAG: hypothetical protein IPL39_02995 [Opitutaceae bacterium]|nr:hypothetical protein [Opitutaceae bacterium]
MTPALPRRQFLRNVALTGGILGLSSLAVGADKSLASPSAGATQATAPDADSIRLTKVKNAMLAMQRRAWEQGTAAQALLELGETDLVVLFAKDAVVNQLRTVDWGSTRATRRCVTRASTANRSSSRRR